MSEARCNANLLLQFRASVEGPGGAVVLDLHSPPNDGVPPMRVVQADLHEANLLAMLDEIFDLKGQREQRATSRQDSRISRGKKLEPYLFLSTPPTQTGVRY